MPGPSLSWEEKGKGKERKGSNHSSPCETDPLPRPLLLRNPAESRHQTPPFSLTRTETRRQARATNEEGGLAGPRLYTGNLYDPNKDYIAIWEGELYVLPSMNNGGGAEAGSWEAETSLWGGVHVASLKVDAARCDIIARRLACSVTCHLLLFSEWWSASRSLPTV